MSKEADSLVEAAPTPSGVDGGGETLEADRDEATKIIEDESELTMKGDGEPEVACNVEPLVPALQPSEPAAQQEAAQKESTKESEAAGQQAAAEESTVEIDVAAEPASIREPVEAAPVVEAALSEAAEQLGEEGTTSPTSVESGVTPAEAYDQPRTEAEEPKGNLLSAALSGVPTPSATLTHLTRGRPASMNNRKRPTSSRRAKALGITVGPQTKEVIEPPRAMEESSAEEPNGSSGEEVPRRPDPLANRPSLMPGRIRSSPDMALELRGALFARGATPPGSPQPLRLPSPVRMSLPTIEIPPPTTTTNDETKPEKAAEEAAAPQVSPKRGLKGLLFGGRNADSKKSPRAKSPRKTKTIDGLPSPGKGAKPDS